MSTPYPGQALNETLGGTQAELVASDGRDETLANMSLIKRLQLLGLGVDVNSPDGCTAMFNGHSSGLFAAMIEMREPVPAPDEPQQDINNALSAQGPVQGPGFGGMG